MSSISNIPEIIARRQKRRKKSRSGMGTRVNTFAGGMLALVSVVFVVFVIGGALAYSRLTTGLPNTDQLPELLDVNGQLRHPTRVFDRSGQLLLLTFENANAEQAQYIYHELLPSIVVEATLDTIDPDFWEHAGYLPGAVDLTLAERLVTDLLLWQEEPGVEHTWRTNLLAAQITSRFGREKVLEWFLNNADYGQSAHGVDQAAWVYFGKPVSDVTLAEAAMLAAIVQAPELNPIDTPQVAIERQSQVLQTMLRLGTISEEQAFTANANPIHIQPPPPTTDLLAPDFLQLTLDQLDAVIGKGRVRRGGLEIITTLDVDLQFQAACSAQIQIDRLAGKVPLNSLGGQNCPGAALLPTLKPEDILSEVQPDAGIVVIDPASGQILALVGDPGKTHTPGTILSPFVYLTAFTRGMAPATLVWDIPASIPPQLEGFGNPDDQFRGPMRSREAMANDYVVPALEMLTTIGPANVWRIAQQSGLHSLETPGVEGGYRLLLDQGEVDLVEATHAFSMFSNQGTLAGQDLSGEGFLSAITVLSVQDYAGRSWLDWNQTKQQPIASPQLAYLVTDVLADELARRDSLGHPNPLETGRPSAAKIGQTADGENTWTIGYTPQRVVGVWLGTTEISETQDGGLEINPMAAAGLWHAVMKTTFETLPLEAFQQPVGIVEMQVCNPSGLLPTQECPETIPEIFIQGSEPVQTDNLYQTFLINNQTNRLATVFTPPEFVEERVYLVVPSEAEEWAQNAGLETPPNDYDVIFNPATSDEKVSILAPEIFSYISGNVSINGRANTDDFAFYRVQVGEGLNPRQWLQIGENTDSPVEEGRLAVWQTESLNGLYAIQLLVVDQDQTVTTTTIQVTIDNQPPTVQIIHPAPEQVFEFPAERSITFQVQAQDNLQVGKVEFLVDGTPISNLAEPPFAVPWTGNLGDHVLTVIVTDLAGNQAEALVKFSLER